MKKVLLCLALLLLLFFQSANAKDLTVKFNFPIGNSTADVSDSISIQDDANAFSAFAKAAQDKSLALDVSYYDFDGDGIKESAFINSVNGLGVSDDFSKYWQFSLNNKPSMEGASSSIPQNNDIVSLDYFEGFSQDSIEWLVDNQFDGKFGSNLFQSSFGQMAASIAGDSNVSIDSSVLENGKNYILSQQNAGGLFADNLQSAVATMALISSGMDLNSFEKNGKTTLDLLKESQLSDGGFKSGSSESDVDTTSWASIAFAQAGQPVPDKNGMTPIDFLEKAQHSNGSFGYTSSDSSESIDFTEEAIIAFFALNRQKDSVVENSLNWLSGKQDSSGCVFDGFRTAMASIAFRSYAENDKADFALNCLKTMPNGDGSFGRSSNVSNAMDTAIAVLALGKKTFPLTVSISSSDSNGFVGLNSLLKFSVKIKNTGKVKARNVNVLLDGIPSNWIVENGSVKFFDSISVNETKTAEIFVKPQSTGTYIVKAIISGDTISASKTSTNSVNFEVDEAQLDVSINYSET